MALAGAARRPGKLVAGGTAFLLITSGVFWWQFSAVDGDAATPRWDELRWAYLVPLLLCLPIETLACGLRIRVIARVLEPDVRLSTCIKAEWAQVAVSTLTPTQSGGGPGQIYIMHREGTSIGTAVTVMLLSCSGTMVALLGLGLYALLADAGDGAGRLLRVALWTTTGVSAVMVLLAIPPAVFRVAWDATVGPIRRLFRACNAGARGCDPGPGWSMPALGPVRPLARRLGDIIEAYRRDTRRFVRTGKAAFALVCALSVAFILSRAVIAYLVVRFLGIETSTFRHILDAQIVVLLVEFVAPTPGGAGVVEGASVALMGAVVPPGHVPHYNLLWRFTTLYLPALAGFVCLAWALVRDARSVAGPASARRGERAREASWP